MTDILWGARARWRCIEKGETVEPARNGQPPEPTAGQKALRALRLTQTGGLTQAQAARLAGTTERQIQAARLAITKAPWVEEELASGQMTLNAAQVAAGFRTHKPVTGRNYGKGDKWLEIANALSQYLAGWRGRGFRFTHVPPKEAERRVQVIDEMIAGLQEVRADLEARSHRATSALPSPK